jgi:hypothetical protein
MLTLAPPSTSPLNAAKVSEAIELDKRIDGELPSGTTATADVAGRVIWTEVSGVATIKIYLAHY